MKPAQAIHRILDANYNRAKEATRVIEDLSRFALDNHSLTRAIKNIRHEITRILLTFPVDYTELVQSRDSKADVGKRHVIYDRVTAPNLQQILLINLKRCQESMRVLEEVSKTVSRSHSDAFKKIRFELYELEKKILRKF